MDRVPPNYGVVFDPETLALLRACLDDAWAQLNPVQKSNTLKSELALRITAGRRCGRAGPGQTPNVRAVAHSLSA
jgi:hypothetical protein